MKNLTMIIHADVEQMLADVLRGMDRIPGFTFTHVQGHGPQDESDPALSARDRVVGYTPHVRVDILLEDRDVDTVLERLRTLNGGMAGRGIYWVSDVIHQGRL
jgi:nitrogen regulatory protein P-II 1